MATQATPNNVVPLMTRKFGQTQHQKGAAVMPWQVLSGFSQLYTGLNDCVYRRDGDARCRNIVPLS